MRPRKVIAILGLLLMLLAALKLADYGINYYISKDDKITSADSTEIWNSHGLSKEQADSIFKNIESVVVQNNVNKSKKVIDSLTKLVKIATPISVESFKGVKVSTPRSSLDFVDTLYRRNPEQIRFYLVTTAGYITDRNGQVQYFMPAYDNKYYYELVLHIGNYTFQTLSTHDTIPFVVDKTGVYKLGFQENHPNFIIIKDSLP